MYRKLICSSLIINMTVVVTLLYVSIKRANKRAEDFITGIEQSGKDYRQQERKRFFHRTGITSTDKP